MESTTINDTRLSPHFRLGEFISLNKYPDNKPTMQHVANMTYGCVMLLEPARQVVGPIIVNSGYRNEDVNRMVGGVRNSQHLLGQAADIRPRDAQQFQCLVDFLRTHPQTDQPADRPQRLAPRLVESLHPAPPLHQDWVLQIDKVSITKIFNVYLMKIIVETFGNSTDFSYLCKVIKRKEKRDSGHPV